MKSTHILCFLIFTFFHFNCLAQNTVSIANDKMNFLYIGLDNFLTVAVEGVKDKHIRIECKNLKIEKRSPGKYIAQASFPGVTEIIVFKKNKPLDTITYRIKRLPAPKAFVGNKEKGIMSPEKFKVQLGITCYLQNFDIDMNCIIVSFDLIYIPKGKDPISTSNSGGKFTGKALKYVQEAASGDYYYFEKIMARCPGDRQAQNIDSMIFKISNDKKGGY